MFFWHGKVAIVTGGSSGLGSAIAEAFVAAGARVAIAGLEADAVEQVTERMRAAGHDVIGIPADITRQKTWIGCSPGRWPISADWTYW